MGKSQFTLTECCLAKHSYEPYDFIYMISCFQPTFVRLRGKKTTVKWLLNAFHMNLLYIIIPNSSTFMLVDLISFIQYNNPVSK